MTSDSENDETGPATSQRGADPSTSQREAEPIDGSTDGLPTYVKLLLALAVLVIVVIVVLDMLVIAGSL